MHKRGVYQFLGATLKHMFFLLFYCAFLISVYNGKKRKICSDAKRMISTSEWRAEHLFASQNTQ